MKIELRATNAWIKQMRNDLGWRIEFDLDESQYDIFKDLPKYKDKLLKLTIEDV